MLFMDPQSWTPAQAQVIEALSTPKDWLTPVLFNGVVQQTHRNGTLLIIKSDRTGQVIITPLSPILGSFCIPLPPSPDTAYPPFWKAQHFSTLVGADALTLLAKTEASLIKWLVQEGHYGTWFWDRAIHKVSTNQGVLDLPHTIAPCYTVVAVDTCLSATSLRHGVLPSSAHQRLQFLNALTPNAVLE